jgi:hypothetical protein
MRRNFDFMRRLDSTPTVTGTFSMGSSRKVMTLKMPENLGPRCIIPSELFDQWIDEGYDDIVIICPSHRYVSTIDDWLDYGYIDLDYDVEVRVLPKAYFGSA